MEDTVLLTSANWRALTKLSRFRQENFTNNMAVFYSPVLGVQSSYA